MLKFIPTKARVELEKLNAESSRGVRGLIFKFHNCFWNISTCGKTLDEIPSFNWINLHSVLERKEIRKVYNFAASKFDKNI